MATLISFGTGNGGVANATVAITLNANYIQGGQTGTLTDYLLTNNNSPGDVQYLNLVSGNNTINATTCPALPQSGGVLICPPNGNGVQLTLKGISADTGIPLSLSQPFYLPFNATPPTSFVLNSANTLTGLILIWI